MKRYFLLTSSLITLLLANPVLVEAQTVCPPSLGKQFVNGDLTVNGKCELTSTFVQGTVTVASGGDLLLSNSATVSGNIEAIGGAGRIRILDSNVLGRVRIIAMATCQDQDGDDEDDCINLIQGSTIRRLVIRNNDRVFLINDNVLLNDLVATDNSDELAVDENTIDGSLNCLGNSEIYGAGNVVSGQLTGQCEGFDSDLTY